MVSEIDLPVSEREHTTHTAVSRYEESKHTYG